MSDRLVDTARVPRVWVHVDLIIARESDTHSPPTEGVAFRAHVPTSTAAMACCRLNCDALSPLLSSFKIRNV